MTDYQESQKILSPLNSGPSICVDFQISSKLKPLQLLLKTVVTIKFTTLRNYGLIDDRCQYCQVSNLTGIKNHKKLLSLLNSPPSLCVEYKISSKLKYFRPKLWLERWQVSTLVGVKNHRKLLSSMNLAPSNCSLCKISFGKWLTSFPVPRSPFPFLKIASSVECISNLTLNSQKIIDYKRTLKAIRYDNLNELIFAHLNINSIKNNFEELISHVKGAVDVLMISETKIDDSFPIANFLIDRFSQPYKKNRNSSVGGIMLYGREDIPSNLLKVESLPLEGFYVEFKLRSKNWLINCSYNLSRNAIGNHLEALRDFSDFHSSSYNNIIILGDFNVGVEEPHMKTLCEYYSLQILIK